MAYELYYRHYADDALSVLENDPAQQSALHAVERVLASLAQDPFNRRLGTTGLQSPEFGNVSVTPARYDDWHVIWQRGPQAGEITVIAVTKLRL